MKEINEYEEALKPTVFARKFSAGFWVEDDEDQADVTDLLSSHILSLISCSYLMFLSHVLLPEIQRTPYQAYYDRSCESQCA